MNDSILVITDIVTVSQKQSHSLIVMFQKQSHDITQAASQIA